MLILTLKARHYSNNNLTIIQCIYKLSSFSSLNYFKSKRCLGFGFGFECQTKHYCSERYLFTIKYSTFKLIQFIVLKNKAMSTSH